MLAEESGWKARVGTCHGVPFGMPSQVLESKAWSLFVFAFGFIIFVHGSSSLQLLDELGTPLLTPLIDPLIDDLHVFAGRLFFLQLCTSISNAAVILAGTMW